MYATRTILWATMLVLLTSCGGTADEPATTGAGGAGAGASTASGGAGGSGGAAGAGAASGGAGGTDGNGCPFATDLDRQRAERLVMASINDAAWVVQNTHSHGIGASRAFGTVIPFTTQSALYALSLAEACTGPKSFDAYCEAAEPGGIGRCSQLRCEATGVLEVRLWSDVLPATVGADPPPGDVTVTSLDLTTVFEEVGTDAVTISWSGTVALTLPDAHAITWHIDGGGEVADSGATSATIGNSFDGFGNAPVATSITASASGGVSGSVTVQGTVIGTANDDGVTWAPPCDFAASP